MGLGVKTTEYPKANSRDGKRIQRRRSMSTQRVMRMIDKHIGLMECRVCGYRHSPMIRPGSNGQFQRGAWQCPNGCEVPNSGTKVKVPNTGNL